MTEFLTWLACLGTLAAVAGLAALTVHVGRLTTAVAEHDEWHNSKPPAAGSAADPIATAQRFADGAKWIP
jgi:hypothetical protein